MNLSVELSYSAGIAGSFGLPNGWTFSMAYIDVPGDTVTSQGRTYVIDFEWADITGYKSGLKYINQRGIKFEYINPSQPLPSGLPGEFAWRFSQIDGSFQYYDEAGKLLESDDIYGNHIYYAYTDSTASPDKARIDYIVDSWGQKVQFGYQPGNYIQITAPDGGISKIVLSGPQKVHQVVDPLGNTTTFAYTDVASQYVLSGIEYPSTLVSRFMYQTLEFYQKDGSVGLLPAVQDQLHLDGGGNLLERTNYRFGEATSNRTFTGYADGYKMGGKTDSLMDGNDGNYRYLPIFVQCFPIVLLTTCS